MNKAADDIHRRLFYWFFASQIQLFSKSLGKNKEIGKSHTAIGIQIKTYYKILLALLPAKMLCKKQKILKINRTIGIEVR